MNAADIQLESGWKQALCTEFEQPYFHELIDFVKAEYRTQTIFPKGRDIFRALDATPLPDVRVVILGQDPYHGPGQANGLCFSVAPGIPLPPSLRNIFKEINTDLGIPVPTHGDLSTWAEQGVLLLNATLTVRAHQAASHQGRGWEAFTDAVIGKVSAHCEHVVFLLWGSYARKKGLLIDRQKHLVLESPHPSPLSVHRGFLGNGHFSKANAYLEKHGRDAIRWELP